MSHLDPGIAEAGPPLGLPNARWPLLLSFGTMAVTQAGRLVGALVLARALGPEGRGVVAAAVLWPTLLSGLGALGLPEATTFRFATPTGETRGIVPTAIMLAFGTSVIGLIAGLFLVPAALSTHGPEAVRVGLIALLYLPASLIAVTLMGALNGLHRFTAFYAANMVLGNAHLPLILMLAASGRLGIASATAAQVTAPFVTVALVVVLLRGRLRDGRPSLAMARSLLSYGARVHVAATVGLLSLRIDQIVIALFLASTDLGIYVVAISFGGLVGLPGQAITAVALPLVARADPARRGELASMFIAITVVLSVGVAIPIILLAQALVPWLFGAAFAEAVPVARLIAVGTVAFSVARTLASVLQATGRPGSAALGESAGAVAKSALLPLLMPPAGIAGAGIAASAGFMVTALWQALAVARHLRIGFRRMIWPDTRMLLALITGNRPDGNRER